MMVTGPRSRLPMPTVRFELLHLPLFDSQAVGRTPHNARSEASALNAYVIAEERHSHGRRSTRLDAEQARNHCVVARHAGVPAGA
jgi:hypothetical protein